MKAVDKVLESYIRLSLRERALIVAAAMVAVYFAIDGLLLTPQHKRISQLEAATRAARSDRDTLAAELVRMEAQAASGMNPLAARQAEIAEAKRQIAAAEAFYGENGKVESGLKKLLDEVLKNNPQVSLAGLRTIPASEFVAPQSAKSSGTPSSGAANASPIIYRSGLEINLKGNYVALLDHMRRLERGSSRLFWADARLDATTYPQATLRLVIYTLGEDAGAALR